MELRVMAVQFCKYTKSQGSARFKMVKRVLCCVTYLHTNAGFTGIHNITLWIQMQTLELSECDVRIQPLLRLRSLQQPLPSRLQTDTDSLANRLTWGADYAAKGLLVFPLFFPFFPAWEPA